MTARRTRQYAKRQLTWFRRDATHACGCRPAISLLTTRRIVDAADRLLRAAVS